MAQRIIVLNIQGKLSELTESRQTKRPPELFRGHQLLELLQILPRQHMIRINLQRSLQMSLSFGVLPSFRQRAAKIRLSVSVIRMQPNGGAKLLDRAGKIVRRDRRAPEIVMRIKIIRPNLQREIQVRDSFAAITSGE